MLINEYCNLTGYALYGHNLITRFFFQITFNFGVIFGQIKVNNKKNLTFHLILGTSVFSIYGHAVSSETSQKQMTQSENNCKQKDELASRPTLLHGILELQKGPTNSFTGMATP